MEIKDKIIREISIRRCIDPRVVKAVVYHPLLFAKRRMEDDSENRPIRIKHFGVFVQKFIKTKKFLMGKRYELLIKNLDSLLAILLEMEQYKHLTNENLTQMLSDMLAIEDQEGIAKIYYIWSKHKK